MLIALIKLERKDRVKPRLFYSRNYNVRKITTTAFVSDFLMLFFTCVSFSERERKLKTKVKQYSNRKATENLTRGFALRHTAFGFRCKCSRAHMAI